MNKTSILKVIEIKEINANKLIYELANMNIKKEELEAKLKDIEDRYLKTNEVKDCRVYVLKQNELYKINLNIEKEKYFEDMLEIDLKINDLKITLIECKKELILLNKLLDKKKLEEYYEMNKKEDEFNDFLGIRNWKKL